LKTDFFKRSNANCETFTIHPRSGPASNEAGDITVVSRGNQRSSHASRASAKNAIHQVGRVSADSANFDRESAEAVCPAADQSKQKPVGPRSPTGKDVMSRNESDPCFR
jgi:hypothetical protein